MKRIIKRIVSKSIAFVVDIIFAIVASIFIIVGVVLSFGAVLALVVAAPFIFIVNMLKGSK